MHCLTSFFCQGQEHRAKHPSEWEGEKGQIKGGVVIRAVASDIPQKEQLGSVPRGKAQPGVSQSVCD